MNKHHRVMKFSRRCETGDEETTEPDRSSSDCVKVVGNNIYFYADICQETIMKLNIAIKEAERDLTKASNEFGFSPEINLFIQSDGGDVYYGMSAMDHIQACKIHVNTIVDGCACSAATLMLLGGHSKYVMRHSSVLIHQIRTGFWGRWEDLKDEHKNCENIMNVLKDIYMKQTKLSESKLKTLLKRELFLTSEECIKYGIADDYY
jgi:ATP-dependent Clp endopeptidase proteolytic subunit ClpP